MAFVLPQAGGLQSFQTKTSSSDSDNGLESESDIESSSDESDTGIPAVLPAANLNDIHHGRKNRSNADDVEDVDDILAAILRDDQDSADDQDILAGEDDFRVTSDIVPANTDKNEAGPDPITVAVVADILSQMPESVQSSSVQTLLAMPALRPCTIAEVWMNRKIQWERTENVESILTQCVGKLNPTPCSRCSKQRGPWNHCYSVPGLFSGACGNCKYNAQGAKCDHYDRTRRAPGVAKGDGKARKKRKRNPTGNSLMPTQPPSLLPPPAAASSSRQPSSTVTLATQPQVLGQRMLQVPVPTDMGWEDAMTLRRVLQEMTEQLVFTQHGTKVVRKVLRDFSGALEDFASEEQA